MLQQNDCFSSFVSLVVSKIAFSISQIQKSHQANRSRCIYHCREINNKYCAQAFKLKKYFKFSFFSLSLFFFHPIWTEHNTNVNFNCLIKRFLLLICVYIFIVVFVYLNFLFAFVYKIKRKRGYATLFTLISYLNHLYHIRLGSFVRVCI